MKRDVDIVTVFQESFSIFLKNPIIIVPVLIPLIINLVLMFFIFGSIMAGGAFKMMGGGNAPSMGMGVLGPLLGIALIILVVITLLMLFAHGMVIGMAKEAIETGSTSINTGLDVAKSRFVDILNASFLIGVIILIGFILLVLPGLAAMFFLMLAIPSVVAGGTSAVESLKESYSLIKENVSSSFLLFLGIVVVCVGAVILGAILNLIPFLGQIAGVVINGALGGYLGIIFVNYYLKLKEGTALPSFSTERGKFCKKCGTQLDFDARYCERCGMPAS